MVLYEQPHIYEIYYFRNNRFVLGIGTALTLKLGSTLYALLLFVILKIIVDTFSHLREHGGFFTRTASGEARQAGWPEEVVFTIRRTELFSPKDLERTRKFFRMIRLPSHVALVLVVAGNLLFAWLFGFGQELESPGAQIVGAGFLVLAIEFLAIYAGGITSGKRVEAEKDFSDHELPSARQKRRMALLVVLVLVSLLAGRLLEIEWLSYFFVASLLVKYVGHRAVPRRPVTIVSIVWFLVSLSLFLLPESLLHSARFFSDGTVSVEQRLLFWGAIYFAVYPLAYLILSLRKTSRNIKYNRMPYP